MHLRFTLVTVQKKISWSPETMVPSKPIDTAGLGSLLANKTWAPLDLGEDAAGHVRSKG